MSDFDAMFNLAAPERETAVVDDVQQHVAAPVLTLPHPTSFGSGIALRMRQPGNAEHRFIVISKRESGKSITLTTLMTSASPGCADTMLSGAFGCLQATVPEFTIDASGGAYEAPPQKKLLSDGGDRYVNTMVLSKDAIRRAVALPNTPVAFKESFVHFEVAPQGNVNDLTAQYGVAIVNFHLNAGKRASPVVGDEFKVADFVIPVQLSGEDGKEYHAGGAMGILPYHTVSSDMLEIIGKESQSDLASRLVSSEVQRANLTVLAYTPALHRAVHDHTKQAHATAIAESVGVHLGELASALKPGMCDPSTVGKPESRAIFMDPDIDAWTHHIGKAAVDPKSCNLGRISNMVCLTTNPVLSSISGTAHLFDSSLMETAAKISKGELDVDGTAASGLMVGVKIKEATEREYADAKMAKAGARNAPKIMEADLEILCTTPAIVKEACASGKHASAICRFTAPVSFMTHHYTAPLGVNTAQLSKPLFDAVHNVATVSFVGSVAQNTNGMSLDNDKAKETIKSLRSLHKQLGVIEMDLISKPEGVVLNADRTLAFAFKLTSKYVKNGLGMEGGGDFTACMAGSITDQVETSAAAAKAFDESEQAKYNRTSNYKVPKCLAASNLVLTKDAAYSCINQDGAIDIRGTVYAFVPAHGKALAQSGATVETLEKTEFGENAIAQKLSLTGVPGELVTKVHHNMIFLIQKRIASPSEDGGGASISVARREDDELDFSYMESPAAKKAKKEKAKK